MRNDDSSQLDRIAHPDDLSSPGQRVGHLPGCGESARWRASIPIEQLEMDALELF